MMAYTEYEQYKADTAAAYLRRVKADRAKADAMRLRLEERRMRLTDVKAVDYSAVRVSSAASDGSEKLAAMVDDLDELSAAWADALAGWNREVAEASAAALRMSSAAESSALMDYYIQPSGTWEEIASRMGYTYDGIMKVRQRALLSYYDVMPAHERPEHPAV